MKESRYYNLLLMLILLVISCNLKSKESAAGGASVSGVTVDKDLSRAKRDDKQESIDVKFDNLLSTFKLQGEEVELVKYIRSAVTDSDVGIAGDKTYTDLEFYNLLVNLGDARLKGIIAAYLGPFKERKEAQLAIDNLNGTTLKRELQELQDWLKAEEDSYLSELRRVFNGTALDSVHDKAINSNYSGQFLKLKADAEGALKGKAVYEALIDYYEVIEDMRKVVINPDIGRAEGYKTYTNTEFYTLLGNLGKDKVKEIMEARSETSQILDEALIAIKGVTNAREKKNLSEKLTNFNSRYLLEIKKIFNESTPDAVYNSGIRKSIYMDHFLNIKNEADAKNKP
ncbi:hypothetical protein A0V01_05065 (plasmid) [Borrelia hermsii]|uniref:Uncharacterized protein n=1 Tax=Borrelia hermsii TaxID=140 RepID=A0AAN1CFG3_BORHE|nr:hypothetical protein [Borrelia hermsii]AMR75985.1 hypothetical protein A0V01_05065 [Borrelia hermsii]